MNIEKWQGHADKQRKCLQKFCSVFFLLTGRYWYRVKGAEHVKFYPLLLC